MSRVHSHTSMSGEGAEIIRFPVERRRASKLLEGAHVTIVHGAGVNASITSSSVPVAPAWWGRVPDASEHSAFDDRAMWMKLGATPATRAKRHRVISVHSQITNGDPYLIAVAACGRTSELSLLFDDPWSGGDCGACRKRGWR